jgi:hypothetical protein
MLSSPSQSAFEINKLAGFDSPLTLPEWFGLPGAKDGSCGGHGKTRPMNQQTPGRVVPSSDRLTTQNEDGNPACGTEPSVALANCTVGSGMNIHKNARLTPLRREEMVLSVLEGRLSGADVCGVTEDCDPLD